MSSRAVTDVELIDLVTNGIWDEFRSCLRRDPNPYATDKDGASLLMILANSRRTSEIFKIFKKLLILGTDPEAIDHYGKDALHYSIEKNNQELARILIEENLYDKNLKLGDREYTHMHLAVKLKRWGILTIFAMNHANFFRNDKNNISVVQLIENPPAKKTHTYGKRAETLKQKENQEQGKKIFFEKFNYGLVLLIANCLPEWPEQVCFDLISFLGQVSSTSETTSSIVVNLNRNMFTENFTEEKSLKMKEKSSGVKIKKVKSSRTHVWGNKKQQD